MQNFPTIAINRDTFKHVYFFDRFEAMKQNAITTHSQCRKVKYFADWSIDRDRISWACAEIAESVWRLIRIGGPETVQYIQLVRDPFLLRFDILLEEGEADPQTKQRYFEVIMGMAPQLIKTGQFFPELLDYFPLPRRIIERWKKVMIEGKEQAMKMREMGIDPTGRGKQDPPDVRQAKIQKLNADTALQTMKAQTLQKRGNLSNVDQMLKVLIAQEQARKNDLTAQQDHMKLAKDTLQTMGGLFQEPKQPGA